MLRYLGRGLATLAILCAGLGAAFWVASPTRPASGALPGPSISLGNTLPIRTLEPPPPTTASPPPTLVLPTIVATAVAPPVVTAVTAVVPPVTMVAPPVATISPPVATIVTTPAPSPTQATVAPPPVVTVQPPATLTSPVRAAPPITAVTAVAPPAATTAPAPGITIRPPRGIVTQPAVTATTSPLVGSRPRILPIGPALQLPAPPGVVVVPRLAPTPPPPQVLPAAPPPPPPLPPPVAGDSVNSQTISGSVTVNDKPLTSPSQLTVGAVVDATAGSVQIVTPTDSAVFSGGEFKVVQPNPSAPTQILLQRVSRRSCPPPPRRGAKPAPRGSKVLARLWGSGRGRFTTSARFSSAAVRGTIWLVADRCDGTYTFVKRGVVAVRDFRRKKTIVLKAGHSYLAR